MRIAIGILLLALATPAATLYEKDGVILEGSARLVTRGAATCQVLAENESAEAYESMKANHDQPLHVWRLDYSALNASGRALGRITAHFQIDAQWPPCTSWTGLGQYPGRVQWAGSFETLQETGGLAPGAQIEATVFVLAFEGMEPSFSRWQVDYGFGEGAPAEAAAYPPTVRDPPVLERTEPVLPEPLCRGREKGAECWMEVAHQSGCYVWNEHYMPGMERPTWTGGCSDGLANGKGTVTWQTARGASVQLTGLVRKGKHEGCTAVDPSDDAREEGVFVNGKRQGRWNWYDESGRVIAWVFFKDNQLADIPDSKPSSPC